MIQLANISMPLSFGLDNDLSQLADAACRMLAVERRDISHIEMLRRAVDARNKSNVHFVVTALVQLSEQLDQGKVCDCCKDAKLVDGQLSSPIHDAAHANPRVPDKRPVIVGSGPAGLFCALVLAGAGIKPRVIERGASVEQRMQAIRSFERTGTLDQRTNVQFGEGGAGTFSDGKLTTGLSDPYIRTVLKTFVEAGAPDEILWQAKPHIGTDLLPGIVKALRERIIQLGGSFEFCTQLTDIDVHDGQLHGVTLQHQNGDVEQVQTQHLVLAVGNSARDTYEMLHSRQLLMRQKPFAMGVRIEHLQHDIDVAQYGKAAGHPALSAADYKLSCHLQNKRSVYTFCMCPGGQVVAAASEHGRLVTNGMSRFARDADNANAALLVNVTPDDFPGASPLAGIELQRSLEQRAFELGGGDFHAPVQLVGDFIAGRASTGLGAVNPSYPIGTTFANLHDILPRFISESIQMALPVFGRKIAGFDSEQAVLTGVETRSSAPLTIIRDRQTWQSSVCGVFPCGEGAGYAGGITSSAIDGMRCAEALIRSLN